MKPFSIFIIAWDDWGKVEDFFDKLVVVAEAAWLHATAGMFLCVTWGRPAPRQDHLAIHRANINVKSCWISSWDDSSLNNHFIYNIDLTPFQWYQFCCFVSLVFCREKRKTGKQNHLFAWPCWLLPQDFRGEVELCALRPQEKARKWVDWADASVRWKCYKQTTLVFEDRGMKIDCILTAVEDFVLGRLWVLLWVYQSCSINDLLKTWKLWPSRCSVW